jgi:hypothetical protein
MVAPCSRYASSSRWSSEYVLAIHADAQRDNAHLLAEGHAVVVTGAIPEDLAREEQERIASDLKQATGVLQTTERISARINQHLATALQFVGRADELYRQGGPRVRRLANQFFFRKLFVGHTDDGNIEVRDAILQELWAMLLAKQFQADMAQSAENLGQLSLGRGSNMTALVAGAGFEPATSGL